MFPQNAKHLNCQDWIMRENFLFFLVYLYALQDLHITECLNFNMRVLDYSANCGGSNCTHYISTKIKFGDGLSRDCSSSQKRDFPCICCTGSCSPNICSCYNGTFSPDRDSKIISNKTQVNESFATIWVAVHRITQYSSLPRLISEFCTRLTLSPDKKPQQMNLTPRGGHDTHKITLQFNVTSDILTTTSETSTSKTTTTTATKTTLFDVVESNSESEGSSAGMIAGVVLGVLAVIGIGLACYCRGNIKKLC